MEEITATKFKATSLAVLSRVEKTKKPVRVTRYGKPVAEIEVKRPRKIILGFARGQFEIVGDIVGPTSKWTDWEAYNGILDPADRK
jgi:antitoxin (DNA-binding transcriptional repressor) of toxin-antitoxin stability system